MAPTNNSDTSEAESTQHQTEPAPGLTERRGVIRQGRILDSDEEERERLGGSSSHHAKRVLPKVIDPLGIWSDEEEAQDRNDQLSDDDDKGESVHEQQEEEEAEETSGTESGSDSANSLTSFNLKRIGRSPEIPDPLSIQKTSKSKSIPQSSDMTAPRQKAVIEISDSDDDEDRISFPVPQVTRPPSTTLASTTTTSAPAPAFPVPQVAKPPPLQPRPHPLLDPNYGKPTYQNAQFKPPAKAPPKVKMLGYNDPILQRQQPPNYHRSELNGGGLKPVIATPIAIPSNKNRNYTGEQINGLDLNDDDPLEPRRTPAEIEAELKELVGHALEEDEITDEINEEEKIVEGFEPGFELLDHQVLARRWMRERETGKKSGGILADDMGLGKTIQMLTRISDGQRTKDDRRDGWARSTLVVCPVGLMDQWEREIAKFAPWMKVVQHHGPGRTSNPAVLERNHVVITSYNIVSNEYAIYEPDAAKPSKSKSTAKKKAANPVDDFIDDSDDEIAKFLEKRKPAPVRNKKKLCALFEVQWLRIALDEAHNIKNRLTKMSIATCNLHAKYRWALTGTPLQNNVEELFPLLKFLQIRPLNDWTEYKQVIADPVKKGRTKRAMKRLHIVLKAVMLRRTKNAIVNNKPILELPARNVQVVECDFEDDEREFYQALADKVALTFNKYLKAGAVMKNYTSVLTLLLRLRQACNHPSLVSKDFAIDAEAIESTPANKEDDAGLADALAGLTVDVRGTCQVCLIELTMDNRNANSTRCTSCDVAVAVENRRKSIGRGGSKLPQSSAKIRKIVDLLDGVLGKEVPEGEMPEKVIIFSQFTSFLDILEPFLQDEHIKFVRVDGSMLPQDRAMAVEKIKRSRTTRVILISFKVGSTGLNLTCCNHVVLTDLWWNPALEDQAFDRAHRMGQKRDVEIYKLTVPQTVEARILELQDGKRTLAAAALSGDKFKSGNKLRLDDLVNLFKGGDHNDDDE